MANLEAGQSLYLRIFPWSRGAMSNKTLCLSDVRFCATLTSTGISEIMSDRAEAVAIYSLGGTRCNQLIPGINIVCTADHKVEKRIIL